MPTQSFPADLKGKAAVPVRKGSSVEINWTSDKAAEAAAKLGFAAEDLEGMVGTGKDGAISVADVKNWAKEYED